MRLKCSAQWLCSLDDQPNKYFTSAAWWSLPTSPHWQSRNLSKTCLTQVIFIPCYTQTSLVRQNTKIMSGFKISREDYQHIYIFYITSSTYSSNTFTVTFHLKSFSKLFVRGVWKFYPVTVSKLIKSTSHLSHLSRILSENTFWWRKSM